LKTVWLWIGDVLVRKYESPAYVAVSDFAPVVAKAMEQLPAATVPVQLCVPSETVTLPVGVLVEMDADVGTITMLEPAVT
jgi:hypothetical protein